MPEWPNGQDSEKKKFSGVLNLRSFTKKDEKSCGLVPSKVRILSPAFLENLGKDWGKVFSQKIYKAEFTTSWMDNKWLLYIGIIIFAAIFIWLLIRNLKNPNRKTHATSNLLITQNQNLTHNR